MPHADSIIDSSFYAICYNNLILDYHCKFVHFTCYKNSIFFIIANLNRRKVSYHISSYFKQKMHCETIMSYCITSWSIGHYNQHLVYLHFYLQNTKYYIVVNCFDSIIQIHLCPHHFLLCFLLISLLGCKEVLSVQFYFIYLAYLNLSQYYCV